MHVGIVYDLKSDYSIDADDVSYCDFSNLLEIQHIQNVLQQRGHHVTLIGNPYMFATLLRQEKLNGIDIIMNFGEGFRSRNRESLVPALCEIYKIPYTFSDSYAMGLTLHKHQTMLFAESLGIKAPKGFLFYPNLYDIKELPSLCTKYNISFPIISKPNREGTSMGLALSNNFDELVENILGNYAVYNQEIRCDEYIGGHEIAVPILGSDNDARVLGIVEYRNLDDSLITYYTTDIKEKNRHKTLFQSFGKYDDIIKETALLIHKSIPCYDISRIDMKFFNNTPYLLEVTTIPGMNPGSTFEMCAMKNGMQPGDMYDHILESAMKRFRGKK